MKPAIKSLLGLTLLALMPFAAQANNTDDVLKCSAIEDSIKRLGCFDGLTSELQAKANEEAKKELAATDKNKDSPWTEYIETSKVDDSVSVILYTPSLDSISGPYGLRTASPSLILRCFENTTAMYINFDGHHMTDHRNYGQVTFRKDKEEAFTKSLSASTDGSALGLWRGNSSIPFIKNLFGGKELLIRATPYGESPVTFSVDITGIEEAVEPLRKACNW